MWNHIDLWLATLAMSVGNSRNTHALGERGYINSSAGLLRVLIVAGTVCGLWPQAVIADNSQEREPNDAALIAASDQAVVKLVQLGTVVKRFDVREIQTSGLLIRLKPDHLDGEGRIDSAVLGELSRVIDPAIEFRGPALSDEGLKQLLENVSPIGLDLSGSRVTDRGLKSVAAAKRLRLLDLSFTGITDHGLVLVAKIPELRHLSAMECAVTDQGIMPLAKAVSLREVYLSNTRVTDAGRQRLQKVLPKCRVEL